LTYSGRFTHISGHPSATGRAQDRESSQAKDRCSTAVPHNQPSCQPCTIKWYLVFVVFCQKWTEFFPRQTIGQIRQSHVLCRVSLLIFLHESTRQKVLLAAMVLVEDHTGAYLASWLKDAVETWKLHGKGHILVERRDNAANMISAMCNADVEDFGWMAHTLQLLPHDALYAQSTVESVVKNHDALQS